MSPARNSGFVNETVDPPIREFLHTADTPTAEVLILTHGAGGNAQPPLHRALADAFSNAGITMLRCNLPYRQLRPFSPPGPRDDARDHAGLKNAVAAMASAMNPAAPPLAS